MDFPQCDLGTGNSRGSACMISSATVQTMFIHTHSTYPVGKVLLRDVLICLLKQHSSRWIGTEKNCHACLYIVLHTATGVVPFDWKLGMHKLFRNNFENNRQTWE